jgi:hypothetical protein
MSRLVELLRAMALAWSAQLRGLKRWLERGA